MTINEPCITGDHDVNDLWCDCEDQIVAFLLQAEKDLKAEKAVKPVKTICSYNDGEAKCKRPGTHNGLCYTHRKAQNSMKSESYNRWIKS